MPTTPVWGIRYPDDDTANDLETHLSYIAEDVEFALSQLEASPSNVLAFTPQTSHPSATANLQLYGYTIGGRVTPWVKDPDDGDYPLQAALGHKTFFIATPDTTSSGFYLGQGVSNSGTLSTVGPTDGSATPLPLAINVETDATAAASGSIRTAANAFRHSLMGGFHFTAVCFFPDASYNNTEAATTGARIFVGMTNNANPCSADTVAGSHIGFARHHVFGGMTHTNWQVFTHNGTTQTATDTGMAFAVNKVYRFYLYSKPGVAGTIWWRIENLTDGTSQSGSITATLPANTVNLGAGAFLTTVNATARNIRVSRIYVENESY